MVHTVITNNTGHGLVNSQSKFDEYELFKKAIACISSSLDMDTVLERLFTVLKDHIPMNELVLFRLRFRAAGQVGDAHQAAFSGGLDLGGEVLAGDALAFSRPEVKGSLAGEVERQGLELQVSDLDHGCSPLRLNGSLLCHVAVKLEGPVPDQPTVAQVAVVHRAGFDADASGALPEVGEVHPGQTAQRNQLGEVQAALVGDGDLRVKLKEP